MPTEGSGGDANNREIVSFICETLAEAGVLPPPESPCGGAIEEVPSSQRPPFDDLEHLEPIHAVRRACDLAIEACIEVDRRAAGSDFQPVGSPASQLDAQQFAFHCGFTELLPFDKSLPPAWWWIVEFESAYRRFMWYVGKHRDTVSAARKKRSRPLTFAGGVAESAVDCVFTALADRYGAILEASTPDRYGTWLNRKGPVFAFEGHTRENFLIPPMLSPGAAGIYSAAVFRKLRSLPAVAWDSLRGEVAAELKAPGGATSQTPIDDCTHTDDFSSVNWFGKPHTFSGNQRIAVRVLWEHWEKGLAASVAMIGREIDHAIYGDDSNARLRLSTVFRTKGKPHSAWGTMIVESGQGLYRLAPARTKARP